MSQSQYIPPKPPRKPFIWDEPAPIIPGSQELPGSASYIYSEPDPFSSQVTQDKPSYASESSGIRLRNSEASSYRPTQLSISNDPIESSAEAVARAEAPSRGQQEIVTSTTPGQSTQEELSLKPVQSVPDTTESASSGTISKALPSVQSEILIDSTRSVSPGTQVHETESSEEFQPHQDSQLPLSDKHTQSLQESSESATSGPKNIPSTPEELPITPPRLASPVVQVRGTEPLEEVEPQQDSQAGSSQTNVSELQFQTQVPFVFPDVHSNSQVIDESIIQRSV